MGRPPRARSSARAGARLRAQGQSDLTTAAFPKVWILCFGLVVPPPVATAGRVWETGQDGPQAGSGGLF